MIEQLNYMSVKPVPSSTVTRAAYFRQPLVQERYAAVELLNVDEATKSELRAALTSVVGALADINQSLIELDEQIREVRAELKGHIADNEWPRT